MNELDLNDIWTRLLPLLEKSLNKPIYETLISSTKPLSFKDGVFTVAVPNEVVKEWLSKHCVTLLEQELQNFIPGLRGAHFAVGPQDLFSTPPLEPGTPSTPKSPPPNSMFLNNRYVFETFVVGQGNRFAHAAAQAVAESPATAYNPFFLYGGVGLGKTHLMQAIGHRVALKKNGAKILYITSEMFTNDLIKAIGDAQMFQFRNKYRNIDILLVDDVQFIAGKERTQEEFFHTFNALYENHKQIVLSSDRPPKEIPTLEERLRSRFEWGLIADIQPPDFETRIAILQKKAEMSGIVVSDEILALIAGKIITNIRELEGALIRVVAKASLTNKEIDLPLVEEALKDILSSEKNNDNFSMNLIKRAAADYYHLKVEDLSAKVRTKEIALARQIAMYLARELTGASLPKIGNDFGGRDHTTVMHACEKIKKELKDNKALAEAVRTISRNIKKPTAGAV